MKNILRVSLTSAFCLGAFAGFSQGWGETNRIEDTEIIVEKDRKIELPTANRHFEKVKVQAPPRETRKVEYALNDLKLPDRPVPVQMRVLTVKQEELPFLYGNYIKGGFGNYITPYLHGYFHNTRNTEYSVGAEVRHLSSARGPVEGGKSGMSNSSLLLNGEAYRDNITVGGRAEAERDTYHYYGYDRAVLKELKKEDIRQTYNRLSGKGFLNNYNSQSQFKGELGIGYNFLKDNHQASEGDLRLEGAAAYSLNDNSAIKAEVNSSFIRYELDNTGTNRSYFRVRPYYQSNFGQLNVIVGGTMAYHNDTLNDVSKVQIYPHAQAAFQVVENRLTLFAGLTGDLERQTLYQLSRENPWLSPRTYRDSLAGQIPNVLVQNTNKQLDVYGGVRGSIGPELAYQVRAGFQRFRNLYFFNNSPLDSARFALFYDTAGTTALYTNLELTYTASDRLRLGVNANFTSWNATNVQFPGGEGGTDKALHRPAVVANIFATYNLQRKLFFTADLYYIGATDAWNAQSGRMLKTDNIADLSLKADYRFSDRLNSPSVFLMLNNLLAKKYERYLYYPVQGIQVMAGGSFTF